MTTTSNLLLSGEVNAASVTGQDQQRLRAQRLFHSDLTVPFGELFFNQAPGRFGADRAMRRALVQALDLAQVGKVLTRDPSTRASTVHRSVQARKTIGIVPIATELEAPVKASTVAVSAFDKGVAALAQYKAREGSMKVPRGHVERLKDGSEVKLGVFLSNSKTRRAKLTLDKLTTLAALGLEWAEAEGAA
ncbi:Helicase associated domain protein [Streptomyces sp. NPDC058357]|uniref:Helicase associated domain protein n=1 Tax=unclassified Streptomyces TaxID=2593676 RepID=UPI003669919E